MYQLLLFRYFHIMASVRPRGICSFLRRVAFVSVCIIQCRVQASKLLYHLLYERDITPRQYKRKITQIQDIVLE
jgi:hypothetical protein